MSHQKGAFCLEICIKNYYLSVYLRVSVVVYFQFVTVSLLNRIK